MSLLEYLELQELIDLGNLKNLENLEDLVPRVRADTSVNADLELYQKTSKEYWKEFQVELIKEINKLEDSVVISTLARL